MNCSFATVHGSDMSPMLEGAACHQVSGKNTLRFGTNSIHSSVISTHQIQHCIMEDSIMLVIPLAAFDGNHAGFKVYVIAFQQDGFGRPHSGNYTVSERTPAVSCAG